VQNSICIECLSHIFFFVDDSVVLTHGFAKKSQKAPVHEIERGEAYRRDFLERRKKHE